MCNVAMLEERSIKNAFEAVTQDIFEHKRMRPELQITAAECGSKTQNVKHLDLEIFDVLIIEC